MVMIRIILVFVIVVTLVVIRIKHIIIIIIVIIIVIVIIFLRFPQEEIWEREIQGLGGVAVAASAGSLAGWGRSRPGAGMSRPQLRFIHIHQLFRIPYDCF